MLKKISVILLVFIIPGISWSSEPYEATWESLNSHPVPKWLQDAKFGIYAHWGLYSVPAYGNEWYAKRMYDKGAGAKSYYDHHVKTYGSPAQFGNKDFAPLFKAENYDPAEWADIIKQSGAKYAGFAVVHHDGFLLWDSAVNRWNAGNMGPKRDLYGELVTELRKRDLKTIATFHHIRTFDWYLPSDPAVIKCLFQPGAPQGLIQHVRCRRYRAHVSPLRVSLITFCSLYVSFRSKSNIFLTLWIWD